MTRSNVFITATQLLDRLSTETGSSHGADSSHLADHSGEGTSRSLRLLDVRWTLTKPNGHEDFKDGHLPGALYVDLDDQLADHTSTDPRAGRHPLPTAAQFQDQVRAWGIDFGTEVVVYDDNSSLGAARAWWLLRWAGVHVKVLDGGLGAFVAAGGHLETGPSASVEAGTVTITPDLMPVIDADAAADFNGVLLDARAAERFRGQVEPLDSKAGHIPGAKNAPATANTTDGYFRDEASLRERFAALGALEQPVGVYCGSGVSACHNALALESLGIESHLYPASWSGWSSDPARPVETGA